jgi:type VI secretion system secreted protein Hcp
VNMQDFHFVAEMSSASSKLQQLCANGKHIQKATLICRKAGGEQEPYLTFELSPVLVSSYQTGASAHGDSYPTDQFSLNYGAIKSEYKGQKNEGAVANKGNFGWDLQKNVQV